jgi:RNA polymerase sigma factor (sigma-70 family)
MKRSRSNPDGYLILRALEGNRRAIEELINRHSAWIFRHALGMIRDPNAAEDITQEVLLIVLTRLPTFRGESSFRAWLHRIITNHVITTKKRKNRELSMDLSRPGGRPYPLSPFDPIDHGSIPVDQFLLVEEAGAFFMMGMLFCLNLEQRFIFILGEIFDVHARVGCQVFEISRVNYRKKLSRARKLVYGFIRERYNAADKKKIPFSHDQRNGSSKPFNGSLKGRGRFEERYHRFRAYFRTQFRRMLEQGDGFETSDPVEVYREMLDNDELRRILIPG